MAKLPSEKQGKSSKKKKASATKFLALKRANDGRFRRKALLRRRAIKRGEDVRERRGVIVLSNLPHGFFEGEMLRYFRQFGVVQNLRLVRSRQTGHSCGYAYVEFEHYEVAKIVAKYMDGYLTFGKIMKCKVIPPKRVTGKLFRGKDIRPDNCPKLNVRRGAIKRLNKKRTEKQVERRLARLAATYEKKVKKLQELGVVIPLQAFIGTLPQKVKKEEEGVTEVTNGDTPEEDIPPSDAKEEEEDQTHPSLPDDASDVDPSEDVNPDLTEEEKGEFSAQRDKLAALIKSHLASAKKKKTKPAQKMVLEVDQSDDEVVLKTPPNVVKKYVKMGADSTLTPTPKRRILMLKGNGVTPKAKKTKATTQEATSTPKVTPKAKKTKLTPKGVASALKNTPKAKKTKLTPKGVASTLKSTPKAKKAKLTPQGGNAAPKSTESEPEQEDVTEEAPAATPTAKRATPGPKQATPKPRKATPKAGKQTPPKARSTTAETEEPPPDTPRAEEVEYVETIATPKTKKRKPRAKEAANNDTKATPSVEVEEITLAEEMTLAEAVATPPTTPRAERKTPKGKTKMPKGKNTPAGDTQRTPTVSMSEAEEITILETVSTPNSEGKSPKAKNRTPKSRQNTQPAPNAATLDVEEITVLETIATPRSKGRTPNAKKQTPKGKEPPVERAQATPKPGTLDIEEIPVPEAAVTPSTKAKTPKAKKQTPNAANPPGSRQDTPGGKKRTPKSKKTGDWGENKENKGDLTLANKGVAATLTPRPKTAATTPTATTPTPEKAVTPSEATPGKKNKKKKGKGSQTPTRTPKATPGDATPLLEATPRKRKQGDSTPLTEAAPSKKKRTSSKTTPGKTVTPSNGWETTIMPSFTSPKKALTATPKTPKKSVTPLPATPGKKTPKVTPGRRRSMLEGQGRKQKTPAAAT